jgi:type IV pilus biogenesis protein CpaD/CtpE
MTLRALLVFLAIAVVVLGACTSRSGGEATEKSSRAQTAAPQDVAPPADSPLSKVQAGMSARQVHAILGEPDNVNAYLTGKSWIPFYFGGDTARTDWMYKGMGRVVFSRNQWSGAVKVIHTIYNPSETAGL